MMFPRAFLLFLFCTVGICCNDAEPLEVPQLGYVQGYDELINQRQYCRLHEARMGFYLGYKSNLKLPDYYALHSWADVDAPKGGEPIDIDCGMDRYAWIWSCVACTDFRPALSGPRPDLNPPVYLFSRTICRLHGNSLSPVARKNDPSRFREDVLEAAKLYFPNAGSEGFTERSSPIDDSGLEWLSSCADCEIAFREHPSLCLGAY